MATSRTAKAERTREALIDAALATIAERGVAGATMREVATRAGVATGLAYHYFSDKTAMVRAVAEERSFLPELRHLTGVGADLTPAEALTRFGEGFLRTLAARGELATVLFSESLRNDEIRLVRQSIMDQGLGLVAEYLQSCVGRGELRGHDSLAIAKGFMMAMIAHHLLPEPAIEQFPGKLAQALVSGLQP